MSFNKIIEIVPTYTLSIVTLKYFLLFLIKNLNYKNYKKKNKVRLRIRFFKPRNRNESGLFIKINKKITQEFIIYLCIT